MLQKLFEDPCLKLCLSFVRDQVSTFQTFIGKYNISATEVAVNF